MDSGPRFLIRIIFWHDLRHGQHAQLCPQGALSAGRNLRGGEPVPAISQTFGGGKSHTPASLYSLATLGEDLPAGEPSVQSFLAGAQWKTPPQAAVAAVSF